MAAPQIWEDPDWKEFWRFINYRDDIERGPALDVIAELLVRKGLVREAIALLEKNFPKPKDFDED